HSYVESLLIISRKLLRISFALLQKNTPFDASFPLFSGLLPLTGIPTNAEESLKKCKGSLHSSVAADSVEMTILREDSFICVIL
ncbi:hypothetical protein K9L63_03375, partial [Candidatus Gracilibacteria bacterium]|nr:hypothetical protein [Candidatus Gracilibacteria bacterium]